MQVLLSARANLLHRLGQASVALWRGLASARYLQVLMVCLFFFALIAGVIPQQGAGSTASISDGIRAAQRGRWGSLYTLIEVAGLHRVFSARGAAALASLLGLACLVRLVELLRPTWALPPRDAVAHTLPRGEAGWGAWRARARDCGLSFHPLPSDRGGAICERWPRRAWAAALYLGALVLLVGWQVEARAGWQSPPQDLVLGETREVELGSPERADAGGLALRLDEVAVAAGSGGVVQLQQALITIVGNADAENALVLRPARPAAFDGAALYHLASGPAMRVSAMGLGGERLPLRLMVGDTADRAWVRARFAEGEQEHLVLVPLANLLLRIVYYPSLPTQGFDGPVLDVRAQSANGDDLVGHAYLTESGRLVFDDTAIDVWFEYFVTVRAQRAPEFWVLGLGALLLLVGLIGGGAGPARRAWVISPPDTSVVRQVALLVRRGADEAEWYHRLQPTVAAEPVDQR